MNNAPEWMPRAFVVPDARLTRVFQHQPQRCASITEYSQATGIDVLTLLQILGPSLDAGVISIESVGAEMFVHTAPGGRPVLQGAPDPAPNLWEVLRTGRSLDAAFSLWTLCRRLQSAGWAVEARPQQVLANLHALNPAPVFAVSVYGQLTPVVVTPTLAAVADPQGRLTHLAVAGANAVAVTVPSGALDDYVTAVRGWFNRADHRGMLVLLLEEPGYAPVAVRHTDAAVAPRSVYSEEQDPRN